MVNTNVPTMRSFSFSKGGTADLSSGKIALAGANNPAVFFSYNGTTGKNCVLKVYAQTPDGTRKLIGTVDYSKLSGKAEDWRRTSFKIPTRHVSYNNGQYETDRIYERKYLSGNDQYAVFLNSNQAQTVIEGSGKSGKLLLIKDSYGNTFSQFPVEDYAEVHVIDLRFFNGDVVEYAKENSITDTLVLYGTQNFAKDTNIKF